MPLCAALAAVDFSGVALHQQAQCVACKTQHNLSGLRNVDC